MLATWLRAPTTPRRLARLAATIACLGVVALAWPVQFGGRMQYVIVSGTSMEPTYRSGDLVVVERVAAYDVGDVVVYAVPEASVQVIHRIVGGTATEGFVTRGDNRERPDLWRPTATELAGREVARIPQGGLYLLFLREPTVFGGAMAGLVVSWVLGRGPAERRPEPAA